MTFHDRIRGKRVAIVDDVINAGSAVRAILGELEAHGAHPIALAALLALGPSGPELARKMDLAFDTIATLPNTVWLPAECPLCASLTPVENLVQ
jgi:orotate phosphoribosyltransferase